MQQLIIIGIILSSINLWVVLSFIRILIKKGLTHENN